MKGDAFPGYRAGENDQGKRLDRIVRDLLPRAGLSEIYRALRKGRILVNDARRPAAYRVMQGDLIRIDPSLPGARPENVPADGSAVSPTSVREPGRTGPAPGIDIEGMILLETDAVIALNKPAGMLVHGPGSLGEAIEARLEGSLPPSLTFRPGPLHRLDRNTSGVLLFSRSLAGARRFAELMRRREIGKYYLALLSGDLQRPEAWQGALVREQGVTRSAGPGERGRMSLTRAAPLLRAGGMTLALCAIPTGRTHQIRAQAAGRGMPLAGDRKYGGPPLPGGYLLHAAALRLPEYDPLLSFRDVYAPLPPAAQSRLSVMFGRARLFEMIRDLPRHIDGMSGGSDGQDG